MSFADRGALCVEMRRLFWCGGGNSAGQAAVFSAQLSQKILDALVRGPWSFDLPKPMSRYPIDRIASLDGIEIHPHRGGGRTWRQPEKRQLRTRTLAQQFNRRGNRKARAIRHVFLFIGAGSGRRLGSM